MIEHITKFDYNNITTYQDEGSQNNYSISKKLQNLSKLSNNSNKKKIYKNNNYYVGPYNLNNMDPLCIPYINFSNYMNDYDQGIYNYFIINPYFYSTFKNYILPNALVNNLPKNNITKILKPAKPIMGNYAIQSIIS